MNNTNLSTFLSGLLPPFSIRNSNKKELKFCNRAVESECALITVLNLGDNLELSKVKILAIIHNAHFSFTMKIEIGVPLVIFGCFDEIQIFVYSTDSNSNFIYSSKLNCCRNWGLKSIKAVNLFNTDNFIEISLKIDNARPQNDYHYNIVDRPLLPVLFNNFILNNELGNRYQCPLCFRTFTSNLIFQNHFEHFHPQFEFEESLETSIPKLKIEVLENYNSRADSTKETEENIHKLQKGVNFCSPLIGYEETDNSHYLDFCSGISIDLSENESENSDQTDQSSEKMINLFKPSQDSIGKLHEKFNNSQKVPSISYFSLKLPTDLVNEIYRCKIQNQFFKDAINSNKAIQMNGIGNDRSKIVAYSQPDMIESNCTKPTDIAIFFIQPFGIKLKSKSSDRFSNLSKCYLNVFMKTPYQFLNSKYLKASDKNFVFFRRRPSKLISYELEKYGLLIQREYNKIDYSDMLANYLNKRIDQHMRNELISEGRYEVMKTWNKLFIQNGKIEECLIALLNIYGFSDHCIEMIELLYTRGLMNSCEIQKVIKATKENNEK